MPSKPEHYQIPGYGQAQPTQIVVAGDGPTTLVNNDTANTVYFDDNSGVNPSRTTTAFLPPQASTSVDGKTDVYAICANGQTADFLTFPGLVPWNNPVGVQIALNALGLMKDSTGQSIKTGTDHLPTIDTNAGHLPNIDTSAGHLPSIDTSTGHLPNIDTSTGHLPSIDTSTADIPNLHAAGHTIANEVSITGVPLLGGNQLVKNQTAVSQAAGVSGTSSTFTMTGTSYEIWLNIFGTTGNFSCFFNLQLQWFDSNTGLQVDTEDYWFYPGASSAGAHLIVGRGPVRANQLVIVSTNPSTSSIAVTHSYVVLQSSKVFLAPLWKTITTPANFSAAGLVNTAINMSSGVVASTNTTVNGGGTTLTRVLPFYTGLCKLVMSTTSGLTDGDLQINDSSDWSQSGPAQLPNQAIGHWKTDSNGLLYTEITLPKGQCQAIITNNNAAAKTFGLSITAEEITVH